MSFSRHLFWLLPAALMLVLIGCGGDQPATPTQDANELNLTDQFGGYKATNEAPGFGDPDILSMDDAETADDEVATSMEIDSLEHLLKINIHSLELLWGHLQYDSTETDVTDWSGSLTVERGAIVALQKIAFEEGDFVVRPRHDRKVLEWTSHTRPSFDGILVYIYDPNPDEFETENSVVFQTALYSRTFTMTELDSISEMIDVGNNQVSINGFKLERLPCEEGFLHGKWIRTGQVGDRGRFHGRWVSKDGILAGHLKGHFGVREDGSKVLFGKWIAVTGAFRGLIKGEWGYGTTELPDDSTSGWFVASAFDRAGSIIGDLSGGWAAKVTGNHNGGNDRDDREGGDDDDDDKDNSRGRGHGFFRGQWSQICE